MACRRIVGCLLIMLGLAAMLRGLRAEESTPVELGAVTWLRDYDAAVARSRETGKPLALLFQEIPGWSTCRDFGAGPLRHPLIQEALESLFVPLAIYNNHEGDDATVLARFQEPAWNNPVLRFVTADGKDLIPRRDGVYTTAALLPRILAAVQATKVEPPAWLVAAVEEATAPREVATFAQGWHWIGEYELGKLDGVLGVRIGWLEDNEVTEVEFNPKRVAYKDLLQSANQCEVAFHVYARSDAQHDAAERALGKERVTRTDAPIRPEPGQKHFLSPDDALQALPMTEAQATRINSIIALQPGKFAPGELPAKAREQLSPRQLRIYEDLLQLRKARPNALSALTPDRSPKGLPAYAATVEVLLAAQSGK